MTCFSGSHSKNQKRVRFENLDHDSHSGFVLFRKSLSILNLESGSGTSSARARLGNIQRKIIPLNSNFKDLSSFNCPNKHLKSLTFSSGRKDHTFVGVS